MRNTLIFHWALMVPLLATYFSCTNESSSKYNTPSAAQSSAPAIGKVVTEIDPRIWCIYQDQNGNHWFGSNGNGVYRYDGQRITQYTQVDGLSGNQVRDIKEDAQGNVFISTTGGVTKFDGKEFTPLEIVEAPLIREEWALNADDIWLVVNPSNNGVYRYDGKKLYHLELSESPAEAAYRARYPDMNFSPYGVYSIYKDKRGHMWFGTVSLGLCRFDGQQLSWMFEERLTTTPGGGDFGIRSIYQDRAGDFWVCNTRQRFEVSSEVLLEDAHKLIEYKKKEGMPNAQSDKGKNFTYYLSMTQDDDGAIWMACGGNGVWKYDGQDVTHYPIGNGAYAISIYRDHNGKLWVGTVKHGIYTFENGSFELFKPH